MGLKHHLLLGAIWCAGVSVYRCTIVPMYRCTGLAVYRCTVLCVCEDRDEVDFKVHASADLALKSGGS